MGRLSHSLLVFALLILLYPFYASASSVAPEIIKKVQDSKQAWMQKNISDFTYVEGVMGVIGFRFLYKIVRVSNNVSDEVVCVYKDNGSFDVTRRKQENSQNPMVKLYDSCLNTVIPDAMSKKAPVYIEFDSENILIQCQHSQTDCCDQGPTGFRFLGFTKEKKDNVKCGMQIHFPFNSYELNPTEKRKLKDFSQLIAGSGTGSFTLEGHADKRGSIEYNFDLAEKRSRSVRDFLVEEGIDKKRLQLLSFGAEKPLSDPKLYKSRRVLIIPNSE